MVPSRERGARLTEHNKPPHVIQYMAEAYPAQLLQTLIMGQTIRRDEDQTATSGAGTAAAFGYAALLFSSSTTRVMAATMPAR